MLGEFIPGKNTIEYETWIWQSSWGNSLWLDTSRVRRICFGRISRSILKFQKHRNSLTSSKMWVHNILMTISLKTLYLLHSNTYIVRAIRLAIRELIAHI